MINILLDEPMELNDKALQVLSIFKELEIFSYHSYHYSDFVNLESRDITELREKSIHLIVEIEKDFRAILHGELDKLNLGFNEIKHIDPSFLLNYRNKRDVSELVISTLSLESLWNERKLSKKFKYFGDVPVLNYKDCQEFMKHFCPEALEFHKIALSQINRFEEVI